MFINTTLWNNNQYRIEWLLNFTNDALISAYKMNQCNVTDSVLILSILAFPPTCCSIFVCLSLSQRHSVCLLPGGWQQCVECPTLIRKRRVFSVFLSDTETRFKLRLSTTFMCWGINSANVRRIYSRNTEFTKFHEFPQCSKKHWVICKILSFCYLLCINYNLFNYIIYLHTYTVYFITLHSADHFMWFK